MARAQELGQGEIGDCAAALPEIERAPAEDILAHALNDKALCFGGLGKRSGLLLKAMEKLVG